MSVSILIVSDLHCHRVTPDRPARTYLVAGTRRLPSKQHPFQSFCDLVGAEIKADVIACPGDLSDQVCEAGLVQAWEHLQELKTRTGAALLLSTMGNHDVDSRRKHGADHLDLGKTFHPEFPVSQNGERQRYWTDGFFDGGIQANVHFVVLNTSIDQSDDVSARTGTFGSLRLEALETYLSKKPLAAGLMRVAIMHHHPILHSTAVSASTDVIPNGDQLLRCLARHGCSLVIHGHRHQARLSRHVEGGRNMIILGAGSFSAMLGPLGTIACNTAHLCTIDGNSDKFVTQVKSWEYHHGEGWSPCTLDLTQLPHMVKFSSNPPVISVSDIVSFLKKESGQLIPADTVIRTFPDVGALLPQELTSLRETLFKSHKIKILLDDDGTPAAFAQVR